MEATSQRGRYKGNFLTLSPSEVTLGWGRARGLGGGGGGDEVPQHGVPIATTEELSFALSK